MGAALAADQERVLAAGPAHFEIPVAVRVHREQPRAAGRKVAGDRPAPEVPDAATTTTSSQLISPAAASGARARIAAVA